MVWQVKLVGWVFGCFLRDYSSFLDGRSGSYAILSVNPLQRFEHGPSKVLIAVEAQLRDHLVQIDEGILVPRCD